jgi:hypothetical protein
LNSKETKRSSSGIYVEILIRAPMEELWSHTQDPGLHQRWDLRFSEITYLPRASASEPQRFRYVTQIGLGLAVAGDGESVGERDLEDGSRSSALRFSSESPLSLIHEGSGYWKYVPTAQGIRFLTWYDYSTRWGVLGRLIDRVAFRPIMGWATAWSFDRLRSWLEQRIEPWVAARNALVHAAARVTLALILAYHGLVPKLLGPHPDEIAMLSDAGLGPEQATAAALALGASEVVLALLLVTAWRRAWPAWLCLLLMPLATVSVAILSPRFLAAAFNPVSLNLAVASLALIDLLVLPTVPTAARCLRAAPAETR